MHAWGPGAGGAAQEALEAEPGHYHALVLKGKALAELGRVDESEQTYRTATQAAPAEPLAWMVRGEPQRVAVGPRRLRAVRPYEAGSANVDADAVLAAQGLSSLFEKHGSPAQRASTLNDLRRVLGAGEYEGARAPEPRKGTSSRPWPG